MAAHSVQFSAVSAPAPSRLRSVLPATATALLVVAGLAVLSALSRSYVWPRPASGEPYNLVVEGFRSGHVWMAKAAPPALASAANPYLFAAYRPYLSAPWGLTDLSYYRGHLYAYFGVTPAVLLFWPYRILTGGWLHQAHAVLIFCILGYAVSVGLGLAVWRRYFPEVGRWPGPLFALLLGSVTSLPVFLARPGLYEVSISCGYALLMVSLAALWNCWHRPSGRIGWLAAASLVFGLAVGARPSLLFASVVLLVPAAATYWAGPRPRSGGRWLSLVLAALLPLGAVGAGLAYYNFQRFGDPLQFGHDYQLSGNNVFGTRSFALRFFWDNFRLYFLEPVRWHPRFPFVWEPSRPALVAGHLPVEFVFGALANFPILLLAGAALLAWRGGSTGDAAPRTLAGISVVLLVLFLTVAVPLCCYAGATGRYLMDFLPALALLAGMGLLLLESRLRSLAEVSPPRSAQPFTGRGLLRGVVVLLLAYSVAVGWLLAFALSSFYRGAESGLALLQAGRFEEAAALIERVARINPDFRGQAEMELGTALLAAGKSGEGIAHLQTAVKEDPSLGAAFFNLAGALLKAGQLGPSAEAFRRAAALDPNDAEAEADQAVVLARMGRLTEAVDHLKTALRINPALEPVRRNLEALETVLKSAPPLRK